MQRLALVVFVWAFCLGGVVQAQARAPGQAVVTAKMTADGVLASVELDRAVERFVFADASVVRAGDFELLTPGLTLAERTVTGVEPFRRFDLRIRPMKEERDAQYPAHYRIGEGGVLYAPALKGDRAEWRTRLKLETAPGQVRAPATGDVDDGFVFIGPARLRSEDAAAIVVADPQAPAWLVARARTDLTAAVSAFTKALGAPLPRKPVLIIKHQDGPRTYNVGDVTPGAVTALRFHGAGWREPSEPAAARIQSFVLHEAFHFWNGGLASNSATTPTWLHEGGAEYAALLGGLASGVLDEGDVRERLASGLQRCRFALQNQGDKGLKDLNFLSSQVRYPCGLVLQWASDLHLRRATAGGRTIMDAWADVIRIARRRPSREYDLADFQAAAGIVKGGASLRPSVLLVEESGPERWEALAGALNALGADVATEPTPEGRRGAVLFHLLGQNCRNLPKGSGRGFSTEANTIKLDSPAGCGPIAGNPAVKAVEGGDLFEMTAETYAAVQRKCAAGSPVLLTTADGRTLAALCEKALAAPPEDYLVRRWRSG
jgi:hypothetical protein